MRVIGGYICSDAREYRASDYILGLRVITKNIVHRYFGFSKSVNERAESKPISFQTLAAFFGFGRRCWRLLVQEMNAFFSYHFSPRRLENCRA
jgi:hypothetical protein